MKPMLKELFLQKGNIMPVPKDKQDMYGKVVGKNINSGKSLSAAKKIADKAIRDKPKKGK